MMTTLINEGTIASSFRDPGRFLFRSGSVLYRQVNKGCHQDYRLLADSGLYQSLVGDHPLIPHQEADLSFARTAEAFKIIRPETVLFISYPYEWYFSIRARSPIQGSRRVLYLMGPFGESAH